MDTSSNPQPEETYSEKNVSFVKDIQLMMFGLGDVSCPLVETAELVESIVLRQMVTGVSRALSVTQFRGHDIIAPEDFLFLMRNDLEGLKRLVEYFGIKDERQMLKKTIRVVTEPDMALDPATAVSEASNKSSANGCSATNPENSSPAAGDGLSSASPSISSQSAVGSPSSSSGIGTDSGLMSPLPDEFMPTISWDKSRKQYCMQFLSTIGIDDLDIESVEDTVKLERQMRANHTSIQLSPTAYETFHAARRASFGASQLTPKRFETWLKTRGGIIYELKPPVIEILVYLAKETIAQLIDRVMILREEKMDNEVYCGLFQMIQPPPISVKEIQEVIQRSFMSMTLPMSLFSRDVPNIIETRLIAI